MSTPRCAAIYARVSTDDQGKGFSIPTQIEACQKLAEREGYTVPESHILVDEGISGTTMDRPELRKLRHLVDGKAIGAVVVHDPDRLSRNLGHQLLLAEEFERTGVTLLIVSHPMEQGPEGWLFFQMRGALAEYERAKIIERTRRGHVGRIRAGHPGGGNVPLGYRYIAEPRGGRWEIDEDEAALVRRIFSLCLAGQSTRKIARLLTAERVPTPSDRHPERGHRKALPYGVWNYSSLRAILTYRGYTGVASWGKRGRVSGTTRQTRRSNEWVTFVIPSIIDASTFDAAQQALQRHQRWASRNRKHDYLLTGGVLRCGRCGHGMSGTSRRGPVWIYRCGSWRSLVDPTVRCSGSLRADEAEAQVWNAVVRVLEQPEIIVAEVTRQQAMADDQRTEIRQQLALIEAAVAKCEREAQRWAKAYAGEVIGLDELKGYRADIAVRRQRLWAEQAHCQAKLEAIGQAVLQVEALTAYCVRVRQELQSFEHAEKRHALEALGIRVTWTPGHPLSIQGRIPLGDIVNNAL